MRGQNFRGAKQQHQLYIFSSVGVRKAILAVITFIANLNEKQLETKAHLSPRKVLDDTSIWPIKFRTSLSYPKF